MSSKNTLVDRWIDLAKNHKPIALVIFGVIILIALGNIVDSISKIIKPFSNETTIVVPKTGDNTIPVHRLYHPDKGFLYTTSEDEKNHAQELGWLYEGIGFRVPN